MSMKRISPGKDSSFLAAVRPNLVDEPFATTSDSERARCRRLSDRLLASHIDRDMGARLHVGASNPVLEQYHNQFAP